MQSVRAERAQVRSQSKPKPTALLEPKDEDPEQFPLETNWHKLAQVLLLFLD